MIVTSKCAESISTPIPATYRPETEGQAVLVSTLFKLTQFAEERRRFGYFVPLSSAYLRGLVGGNYRRTHVEPLIAQGVLEGNDRYLASASARPGLRPFPKSYRLAERHRLAPARLLEIRSKASRRKLARAEEIDLDALEDFDRWHLDNLDRLTIEDFPADDFWTAYTAAGIRNGRRQFKIDEFGHRRHTPLTQLARDARRHLRVDGLSRLSIADVSCCQPLLLAYLAALDWNPSRPFDRLPRLNRAALAADLAEWVELCERRGGLYETIAESVPPGTWSRRTKDGRRFTIDLERMSRADAKRSALIPIFDKAAEMERHPVFRAMAARWPTLAGYLRRIKARDYKAAARLCQRLESAIMQAGVMASLYRSHPEAPTFTIHDALLLTTDRAKVAEAAIRDQWNRLGLEPHVHHED